MAEAALPTSSEASLVPPSGGDPRIAAARSVAVVRMDNIGDHVLGSGLFEGLRALMPEARITALVSAQAAPLYAACPWIDQLVHLSGVDEASGTTPAPSSEAAVPALPAARGRELQGLAGRFDLVLNPRFAQDYYGASAVVRHLAAPRAFGFRQGEAAVDTAYTDLLEAPDGMHVADHAAVLLRALGAQAESAPPALWIRSEDRRRAIHLLTRGGWNGADPLVVLAPGASQDCRQWPQARVMALVEALARSRRARVVLAGSHAELERYPLLRAWHHPRMIDLRALLTLPELAACCRLATLFIGTDSGPKHIAAAAGIPVVEINHLPADLAPERRLAWPTGPRWAALGVPTVQVQPPGPFTEDQVMDGTAIAAVTASQVLQAAAGLLQQPLGRVAGMRLGLSLGPSRPAPPSAGPAQATKPGQ